MATAKTGNKLPAGFKAIQNAGSAPAWDFRKKGCAEFMGTVVEMKSVKVNRREGKKMVTKTERVMICADGNGEMHSIWESSAMRSLFDAAKPKKQVYIRFDGKKNIGGGKKFNAFSCAIK